MISAHNGHTETVTKRRHSSEWPQTETHSASTFAWRLTETYAYKWSELMLWFSKTRCHGLLEISNSKGRDVIVSNTMKHLYIYTLGTKGCYAPFWGNQIDMDRVFVLPLGWNWHEMYLWLLPYEIRPFLGRTFTSVPSGILKVQSHSLCGHFPKSAFALWQVIINKNFFYLNSHRLF